MCAICVRIFRNVPHISNYGQAALDAIVSGKSMGQMLRELPAAEKYVKAYDQQQL